jgi:hypothetical protein
MNYPKFNVINSPVVKKPLKIIFCLPGPSYSGTFLSCWSELLLWCLQNNIQIMLSQQYDAVVYYVRNKCLGGDVMRGINQKPFDSRIDYDYMLWIDSDIVFTPEHLQKLLNWDQDIVSGVYLMQGGTHYASVENWNIEYFKKNGSFQFFTKKDLEGKTGLINVAYTGFGFILIKKGVFESLEYPWFRPLYQEISENVRDFSSEDVSICQIFREKGLKIYIDPLVKVGHEKKIIL